MKIPFELNRSVHTVNQRLKSVIHSSLKRSLQTSLIEVQRRSIFSKCNGGSLCLVSCTRDVGALLREIQNLCAGSTFNDFTKPFSSLVVCIIHIKLLHAALDGKTWVETLIQSLNPSFSMSVLNGS